MRHAEMEEVIAQEAVIQEAAQTIRNLSQDPSNVEWYDYRLSLIHI